MADLPASPAAGFDLNGNMSADFIRGNNVVEWHISGESGGDQAMSAEFGGDQVFSGCAEEFVVSSGGHFVLVFIQQFKGSSSVEIKHAETRQRHEPLLQHRDQAQWGRKIYSQALGRLPHAARACLYHQVAQLFHCASA